MRLVALLALAACGSSVRRTTIRTTDPAEYPGALRDPKTLPHDFLVRQTITIHATRDGKPVDGEFDAVLQKRGDTLLILGFGPMNVKAFTITQRADRIVAEQYMGPDLPFSPRNIVVDVDRVFFDRLPPPADAGFSGVQRGELDGEHVEETWRDGNLRAVAFTRPDRRGAVRVELGAGCDAAHCEPESATLHNEWFGYTLEIANQQFERL